jgi:hypothetical protein
MSLNLKILFFYNGLEYTRISENNQNTETIGFGLNTFLGMKFWINDRLSINTQFEARFSKTLRLMKWLIIQYTPFLSLRIV